MTTQPKSSTLRKAGLFYLVFVMFSYTTGGPFGLEDMVTTSGPGITLLYLLILPFFWCIPVSLVSAELTTAMPVEGGFYRWTRAAFGDFWGFLAGWWNWSGATEKEGGRPVPPTREESPEIAEGGAASSDRSHLRRAVHYHEFGREPETGIHQKNGSAGGRRDPGSTKL